jgi:hypothetical protein
MPGFSTIPPSASTQKIYNYLQLSAAPSAVEIGIVRSLLHP